MKNLNTIIKILSFILILPINIIPGFESRTAIEQQEAYTADVRQGLTATYAPTQGTGPGGCPSTCQTGYTCQPQTASYVPSFSVFILDKNKTNMDSGIILLPATNNQPNQSFTSNAILTVNIFAPSNITSSIPTTGKYIVFYTFKTPDGTNIYTTHESFNVKSGSPSIPHYIAIKQSVTTAGVTSPTPANITNTTSSATYDFIAEILPVTNFPTGQAAWQILNGVSPISQSFLFSINNNSTAITQISGIYDAGNFSSGSSPATIKPSTGNGGLGTLGIAFDQETNPSITFADKTINFTQTDLQNGLLLNIVITSETSPQYNSQGSSIYNIAATLRTSDGTKMRKETLLSNSSNPITTLPSSITIQQSGTSLLTTNFLNSSNTSQNMVLPLNLRFIISQPSGSKNIQVLMI